MNIPPEVEAMAKHIYEDVCMVAAKELDRACLIPRVAHEWAGLTPECQTIWRLVAAWHLNEVANAIQGREDTK